MTDYRKTIKKVESDERKIKLFSKAKVRVSDEASGLSTKSLETDSLMRTYKSKTRTFKPNIKIKDPSSFAFYGSAEKYYADAAYNILNYYPFDGTREEIIGWHTSSHALDSAILRNYWPGTVGHANFNYSEYINFYNGPQVIDTAEFVGRLKGEETGLKLNPVSGNTVEFWLKKDAFNEAVSHEETIFDIGSYPGKVADAYSGQFRVTLNASSSGSPFQLTYKSGSIGMDNQAIGSSAITKASTADSKWHHYAIKVWHADEKLEAKLYVDGKFDAHISSSIATMGSVDTYMGGTIGGKQSASGSLSGSIDDFRFWKGDRDARDIARNFDKRVYASDINNKEYKSRLGLYYRFNKRITGDNTKDYLVVDYSGNDMVGEIKNYSSTSRVNTSAINLSPVSENTEPNDAIMDASDTTLVSLMSSLYQIGQSYDSNNHSMLTRFLPEWAQPQESESETKSQDHFSILLQLMAAEFDTVKLSIDQIHINRFPKYSDLETNSEDVNGDVEVSSSYADNYFHGCSDDSLPAIPSVGNNIDLSAALLDRYGLRVLELPIVNSMDDADAPEGYNGLVRLEAEPENLSRGIISNLCAEATNIIKTKGTPLASSYILRGYGIDEEHVSTRMYGNNTSLFIEDSKTRAVTEEKNVINLSENRDATLYLYATDTTEQRSYIESNEMESEYTFEGNFIFPNKISSEHEITSASVFGVQEVSASNNDLTTEDPSRARIQVSVEKLNKGNNEARFRLSSTLPETEDIYTPYFPAVYTDSRWHISVKVLKDADNKFVTPSTGKYKVDFSGYNYVLDNLQNSFELSSAVSASAYSGFLSSSKSVYLGAARVNITGSVTQQSDIKIINFSAWNDSLTKDELKLRAKSPSITGRNKQHEYGDKNLSNNSLLDKNLIMDIRFDSNTAVPADGIINVIDQSSGSVENIHRYGKEVGYKYPVKSTQFTTNTANVTQPAFLTTVQFLEPGTLHESDSIVLRDSDINKFKVGEKPENKVLSFEKSMYHSISKEMINFLSGIESLNNIIGDPVNKYRKDYKLINHLRAKFFEKVENENQFERYVEYFKWIDSSIGKFLEQVVPASVKSNTGIQNVVESHVLERNKYDYKLPQVKKSSPDIAAVVSGRTEQNYVWQYGHGTPDTELTTGFVWQQDRKETTSIRSPLVNARGNVNSNASSKVEKSYSDRALTKTYEKEVVKEKILSAGSNSEKNKKSEFYKLVDLGKEIELKTEDISDMKKPSDVLFPEKDKSYKSFVRTSNFSARIEGSGEAYLPFTLYSSSVGTDFPDFKQNMKIANNHDRTAAMQGPFAATHVDGMPHRRVEFGTPASNRPEAYDISSSATQLVIKKTSKSKSMISRGLAGHRFYNIANLLTTTASLSIGNYTNAYEIIHTNGRNANNRHLVANSGADLTGSLVQSLHISGVTDFPVPERVRSGHVIVNRFSSPGASESMSAYGLDRESSEYSIYDTVNYRNNVVRHVKNVLASEHSGRFGYRSSSATQASVHKTNRNPLRYTGSLGEEFDYDNFYIQHPMPQNDFGYSWITASANETVYSFLSKNANIGYQNLFNLSGTLKSSETISFTIASDIIPTLDYVGLNSNTTRSVDTETNLLSDTSPDLNSIILSKQGPYGWPTWKQIKGDQHPITRAQRAKNIYSIVFRDTSPFPDAYPGVQYDYTNTVEDATPAVQARTTKNFTEMFATSKFKPLTVSMHQLTSETTPESLRNIDASTPMAQHTLANLWHNDQYWHPFLERSINADMPSVSMRATVQNEITTFANSEMADNMKFKEEDFSRSQTLQKVAEFYKGLELAPGSSEKFKEISYVETIYPRETNTYTKAARDRERFSFFGWNSDRALRSLILTGNLTYEPFLVSNTTQKSFLIPSASSPEMEFRSSYFDNIEAVDLNSTGTLAHITSSTYITSSTWVLDSRQDFSATPLSLTSSFFLDGESFLSSRESGTRGEGILQNDYSIFAMGYNGLRGAPPFAPVYNRRIPQIIGADEYLAGEAKWIAADNHQAPFYDSYEEYSKDIRIIGQDYSLIPEFTISKFIEDIYDSGDMDSAALRGDFLHLTGATYHTSSGDVSVGSQFFKTYSTTDFLKYFQPTQDSIKANNLSLAAGRLTLRCQAAMKFLPYRGFYPAERVVQISELFNRGYLPSGSYSAGYITNTGTTAAEANKFLTLRIENSKAAALKPIMAPGVLFNSIKAGLAVDYPIFSSSVSTGIDYIVGQKYETPVTSYETLGLTSTTCFTGSIVNSTQDVGIPRLSGSVSRRVGFDDILNPERLMKEVIYDNEPHPSASLMYGTAQWTKVLERPSKFGFLDQDETKSKISIDFNMTEDSFESSMMPYKSAINNFAAETVEFFLEGQKLQTVMSEPVEPQLTKNVSYSMKVYINNVDTVMYDRHSAFGPPVDDGAPNIKGYSSQTLGSGLFTMSTLSTSTSAKQGSHGFLPYVPPFLDPNTSPHVLLTFKPKETRAYSIPEIVENITASYYNVQRPSNATENVNYSEAMSISASLDFTKYVKLYSDNFRTTADGLSSPIDPNSTNKYRWVIQPKWETPVMDFKSVDVPTINMGSGIVKNQNGSPWKTRYQTAYYENVKPVSDVHLTSSTGMWHQSGTILKESDPKGYTLSIRGATDNIKKGVGNLAAAVGFLSQEASKSYETSTEDYRSVKLGRLAKKKVISESVVAIPYYLDEKGNMKMLPLNEEAHSRAKSVNKDIEEKLARSVQEASTPNDVRAAYNAYEKLYDSTGRDATTSIAYQLRMMDKYILPPHFDFSRNSNIIPHVAYFFQFKTELTQEDLASIWQNLHPVSKGTAVEAKHSSVDHDSEKSDVEYVTGYLKPEDIPMLSGRESNYKDASKFLENEVRWLVFKIKYRAANYYKDTVIGSIGNTRKDIMILNKESVESNKESITDKDEATFSKFGYNWPYDYFSIAELIKIDSKVDFYTTAATLTTTEETQALQTQTYAMTDAQTESNVDTTTSVMEYEIVSAPAAGGGSGEEVLKLPDIDLSELMVTRETLKLEADSVPSPANQLTAVIAGIKEGTESLYVNGVLQSFGSNADYTISGNTITLTYDLETDDAAYITYAKE